MLPAAEQRVRRAPRRRGRRSDRRGAARARLSLNTDVEIDEVAQREPADDAVEAAVAKRELRGVAAHEGCAGVRGGEHPGREVDADRRGGRGVARSRQRSPVPHARSRTASPSGSPSAATVCSRQRAVEPERDHAVHAVVPRRDTVEHPPRRCGASRRPRAARRCAPSTAIGDSARFPAGLVARGGELGRIADRLEMLLRDLEQHAPEVVRDERGDGGEQRAERVDEPLGLLGVGEIGLAERAADVLVEHLDRVVGDRAGRLVVAPGEREQVGEREAGLEQSQPGTQHVDVVGGVAGPPVTLLGHEESLRVRWPRAAARGCRPASASSSRSSSSASPCWAPATAAASGTSVGVELAVERCGGSPRARSPAAGGP